MQHTENDAWQINCLSVPLVMWRISPVEERRGKTVSLSHFVAGWNITLGGWNPEEPLASREWRAATRTADSQHLKTRGFSRRGRVSSAPLPECHTLSHCRTMERKWKSLQFADGKTKPGHRHLLKTHACVQCEGLSVEKEIFSSFWSYMLLEYDKESQPKDW